MSAYGGIDILQSLGTYTIFTSLLTYHIHDFYHQVLPVSIIHDSTYASFQSSHPVMSACMATARSSAKQKLRKTITNRGHGQQCFWNFFTALAPPFDTWPDLT